MEYMALYLNIGKEQFQFYLQSIIVTNSGRAGGGILRRILFIIEFHRRLGLSELSEMSSNKNLILL